MINSFKGQYRFLSNFFVLKNPILYEGLNYMSSEHFYQAMKTTDRAGRIDIAKLSSAGATKKAGSALVLRPDWEQVKIPVMKYALEIKFGDNPELKARLLATGNEELVEGNYWHDNFWGDCSCSRCTDIQGQNVLGRLLMELRKELKPVSEAFKVIIAGGRDFNNLHLLTRVMDQLLVNIVKTQSVTIVSGGARGADKLGELYAQQKDYQLITIPADWDKFGKSAGYRRNEEMLNLADTAVCFWDSKSRGTKHMIDITTKADKPLRIINY